jgi:group I intron endonuclease
MNTYIDFPNTPPYGYGFIYFLRSPSGKAYIGQTSVSISKRLYMHNKSKGCRFLYAAIKKYGIENFFAGEIGCYPLSDLDAMEVRFIKEFGTLAPDGYNLTTGGRANHKCSDETRKHISEVGTGRHLSEETRKRMSKPKSAETRMRMSKPKSEATRMKMSAAKKGVPKSPEARQKMVEAHKRCPTILSAEARKRISEAKKGKPKSEETRKRMSKPKSAEARKNMSKPKSAEARKHMSEARKGIAMSEESRQRMSAASKGKPKSEEHKRLMREGWRLRQLQKQEPLPLFQNL